MREQNKKAVAEGRAKQKETKEYLDYLEERKAAGVEYPTTEPIPAPPPWSASWLSPTR